MQNFQKIDPKALSGNTFDMYDTGWALVTAGSPERFNTMTISWGGLGWLWGRPVAFTFIRTDRYTYDFVENNDNYTVSFFENGAHRDTLMTLGTKSGRDMDKIHGSGLTPITLDGQPAFAEARAVLVCKKLYHRQFDPALIPDEVMRRAYSGVDPAVIHVAYIAEVTGCYAKG
jgi:flavin reductase (DIM6/NTAB) family NADH-FMN oxidoreductase RutF